MAAASARCHAIYLLPSCQRAYLPALHALHALHALLRTLLFIARRQVDASIVQRLHTLPCCGEMLVTFLHCASRLVDVDMHVHVHVVMDVGHHCHHCHHYYVIQRG